MNKMRQLSFTLFFLCSLANANLVTGQPLPFEIMPENPSAKLVCPNYPQFYYLPQFDSLCYSIHVENGVGTTPFIIDKKMVITWADNGLPGRLVFRKKTNCSTAGPDSVTWPIYTKSLVGMEWEGEIEGPKDIIFGQIYDIKYKAPVAYFPMRGTADTAGTEVDTYYWYATNNWNVYGNAKREVTASTDYSRPSTIKVSVGSTCPNTLRSPPNTLDTKRTVLISKDTTIGIDCGGSSYVSWNVFANETHRNVWIDRSLFTVTYDMPEGWTIPFDGSGGNVIMVTDQKHFGEVTATINFSIPIDPVVAKRTYFDQKRDIFYVDAISYGALTCQPTLSLYYAPLNSNITWTATYVDSTKSPALVMVEGDSSVIHIDYNGPVTSCHFEIDILPNDTCYLPLHRSGDLWIGKDTAQVLVDGKPHDLNDQADLCLGWHTVEVKSKVGDGQTYWSLSPGINGFQKDEVFYFEITKDNIGCFNLGIQHRDLCGITQILSALYFCRQIISRCPNKVPELNITPNVVSDGNLHLSIRRELEEDERFFIRSVEIFDCTGRLLQQVKNMSDSETNIAIPQWPAGIYWVRLDYGDGMLAERFLVR
jgi:hypothetical protein